MSVVAAQFEQPMKGDLFKMANTKTKSEINIWTNKNDTTSNQQRPQTEPRQTEPQQTANRESPLNSTKGLRKSYSASTISTASIKTSSDSSSSISSTSKQSTQTDNSGKSFHINPILVKDARSRNFIVGSITHQSSLLGTEELNKYFPNSTLNIAIITWNMCSKPAKSGTLADLLMPDKMHYLPDLYVIGVQEAPYSNNTEQRDWEIQLQSTIGTEHVVLHSASMGVLHLIVFIRRHLIWYTSRPEHSSVNSKNKTTNMIKTKGAVAISFRIFGTSLLFINSHFPAHEKRNKQRIGEYLKICTQLNLPKNLKSLPIKFMSNDVTNRFDYCFWLGDLNFRIEREQGDMIKELNSTTDFEVLLQNDQLLKAIKEDEIFSKFKEADRIKFGPTYKYNIGTNEYDIVKNRVPSWTDRILYKVKSHRNEVNCLEYNSVLELDTSDHKPVYSLMDIKLKPGKDDVPLNAGRFQREVYLEGIKKRRELWTELKVRDRLKKTQTKSSSACNLS